MQTWSCNSAKRCARSSSLSELGLLSLSSLSLLGSLSEVEEEEDEEEEEEEDDDVGWPLIDMAVWSKSGSSGILAKRNSNTSCRTRTRTDLYLIISYSSFRSEDLTSWIKPLFSPAACVPYQRHHDQEGCTCSSLRTLVWRHLQTAVRPCIHDSPSSSEKGQENTN